MVTETGPGAGLSPGGHVLVVPELPNGAMQESITVSAAELYPVPDTMPVTVAAALHIAYQTAHAGLHHRAALRAGATLLVTGAGQKAGWARRLSSSGTPPRAFVIATATGPRKSGHLRAAWAPTS